MFESSESMTMRADILCPVVCVSDIMNTAVAKRENKRQKEHLTDSWTDWQSRGKALNMYLSLITTESSAVRMCRICESLQWRRIMSMPSSAPSFQYETDVNSTLLTNTVAIMRLRSTHYCPSVASMRLRSTHYCPSQFMSYKHKTEVNTLSITVASMRLRSTHYCPSQFMSHKHETEVNTLLSITGFIQVLGDKIHWLFKEFQWAFFSPTPTHRHFFSRTWCSVSDEHALITGLR